MTVYTNLTIILPTAAQRAQTYAQLRLVRLARACLSLAYQLQAKRLQLTLSALELLRPQFANILPLGQ